MNAYEIDRVRAHTSTEINRRLDRATLTRVERDAGQGREEITYRIKELDRESDWEKYALKALPGDFERLPPTLETPLWMPPENNVLTGVGPSEVRARTGVAGLTN